MEYLVGCLVGGIAVFMLAVFAIRDLKKFYKKEIWKLYKEREDIRKWIGEKGYGEIDPLNKAGRVIK